MEVEDIAELRDEQVTVIEARWRSASSTRDYFAGRERLREFADMRVERGLVPLALASKQRHAGRALRSATRWAYLAELHRDRLTDAQYAALTDGWSARQDR